MKRMTLVAVASILLGFGTYFDSPTTGKKQLAVRQADSRVTFTISKWAVFKEEGRFTDFDGRIFIHPEDTSVVRVEFEVNVRSIDTQNSGRDRRLMAEDFFDADNFPVMRFESSRIEKQDDGTFAVTGQLTIKGVSQEVVVPVTPLGFNRVPDLGLIAGFETEFVVDRMAFGVTGHRWSDGRAILGHDVSVRVLVSASQ